MADLLAANALLATILTILYTLWYPQIEAGIAVFVSDPTDHKEDYKRYKSVLLWKAAPLALGSSALVLINLPDCWEIISYAVSQIQTSSPAKYDAAKATYVLVTLVMVFLAGHTIAAAISLRCNVSKMKS